MFWIFFALQVLAAQAEGVRIESNTPSSVVLSDTLGRKLQVTSSGPDILRLRYAFGGEAFLPPDRLDMVVRPIGNIRLRRGKKYFEFSSGLARLRVDAAKFTVQAFQGPSDRPVLETLGFAERQGNERGIRFRFHPQEHFAGLGHDFTGRLTALDLRGHRHRRNYAQHPQRFSDWKNSGQAPLIVPFYFSSKGYGIFLNSLFPNTFNFGADREYGISIDDHGFHGEIDLFFMAGPTPKKALEQYTDLTGKPRLPPLSIFGLQLSDKVHDHSHKDPSDQKWWQKKVKQHRDLGLAIDHLVNDNRWRAKGGQRCVSALAWDRGRFPDLETYGRWLQELGLTITLDWNRCISSQSAGWTADYNVKGQIPFHEFPNSAPDFSLSSTGHWLWNLFWTQAIDPKLRYPAVDGLWIDEVDEMYTIPYTHAMGGGAWAELANGWFLLIAKALVQNGWDIQVGERKRPYVWMRGMTAGGQRLATMWSGDTDTTFHEMELQLRGMQAAGLSGFAFWGHDAGGFVDHSLKKVAENPDDAVYARWAMQMGAFAPIWKPHGMGQSRWPADRSADSQRVANKYISFRYSLMPYTYSMAHRSAESGWPLARAMLLEFPQDPRSWGADTQYMFGDSLLVAPVFKEALDVFLPKGKWYYYWDDKVVTGDRVLKGFKVSMDELPLWVRAGAILPMYEPALSTFFFNKEKLRLHLYPGADGQMTLTEDDGISERFRRGEKMQTEIIYHEAARLLVVKPARGTYPDAPARRAYEIVIHGLRPDAEKKIRAKGKSEVAFDRRTGQLTVSFPAVPLTQGLHVEF